MTISGDRSGVSRRDFLKGVGVAAGGLLAAGCEDEDPYALKKPPAPGSEAWTRYEEKWVTSVCGQCPAGCGIKVRVIEGRAIKIEGNPAHPVNRGGSGPKGQCGLQLLYHPDRIRGPMRRAGPRGSGQWEKVSWEDAIREVGDALRKLREGGTPQGAVVLDGTPRGLNRQLWARFLQAYGSPNHLDHRATTDGGKVLAMKYMHGVPELPAYDWERTRYILGFGASLFESWCQSIHMTRTSSPLRRGMPGGRVKFVQVSPHFSVTATKADEWVPIRPATYGALALGLGHVLVRDGLVDAEFIREHTFGFEDWQDASGRPHRGFRALLMEDYPPDRVSAITGIPEATIPRLAHEMAENRPAISLADGGAAAATNGLGTAMAIHALNALLGNIERPGGMLVQRQAPLAPWGPVAPDPVAQKGLAAPRVDGAGSASCPLGLSAVQNLPEAVLSGKPYPVQALFLYYSNPVFSKPGASRWIEALRRIPLVVSFSPLLDESAFWADLLLPDATYLERWELVEPVPSVGRAVIGLRQPVVTPIHDTLATGDVVVRLAQGIGSPVAEALPWKDARAATLDRLKGLLGAPGGSIAASEMSGLDKALQKEGGWWEGAYPFENWDGAFRTPSGKFEFFSQAIAAQLARVFPGAGQLDRHLEASGVATRGDALCLPHWEPPRFAGAEAEYPFILVTYRGIDYAEGGPRHLPALRELPLMGRTAWRICCEIHPGDAGRLGLHEGEDVRLESPSGGCRMRVLLAEWVRPGTVGLRLGRGAWPPSPSDPVPEGYGLAANASDPLAGILARQGTRVRVRKEAGS